MKGKKFQHSLTKIDAHNLHVLSKENSSSFKIIVCETRHCHQHHGIIKVSRVLLHMYIMWHNFFNGKSTYISKRKFYQWSHIRAPLHIDKTVISSESYDAPTASLDYLFNVDLISNTKLPWRDSKITSRPDGELIIVGASTIVKQMFGNHGYRSKMCRLSYHNRFFLCLRHQNVVWA